MNEPNTDRDLTFVVADGNLSKIRGTDVPPGTVAAPGVGAVSVEARGVTQRALAMTAGLFDFAERANRPDSAGPRPAVG